MRFSWALLLGIVVPSATASTIPILDDYASLFAECAAGGPDTYISIRYESGRVRTYKYEECMNYSLPDDGLAENLVVCKPASCFDYPNLDCIGEHVLPVNLPIPPGTFAPNVANWYSLFGKSGTCLRIGL